MAKLASLAKDTAVYGLSSIVGRFLNYLLVPLYTQQLAAASGGYGVITEVYSYVALLMVLLTFGMETAFFRFVNGEGEKPERVFSTTLIAVGGVGLLFVILVLSCLAPISSAIGYAAHPEYIAMMAVCVAIDAFQSIPFAYLRYQRRAIKFAALKLLFIVFNIALNLVYFLWMDGKDVGYVFFINLVCTASITIFFFRELAAVRYGVDKELLRRMLRYAWPILILGIAGILNQTVDKMIFPRIVEGEEGKVQLGIYGACVKIAMIMAMIMQAFRYAYEPFVFGKQKDKDNRSTYAEAMKYFVIFTLLAFTCVIAYLDVLKYIIHPDYWEGLRVVPIVMAAEILMGIYFNLSFWYKLTDRTIWGAWFSGIGCAVLVAVNVLCIPTYGYMACAWAGVAGYGTAMVLSYIFGQKYYPISYPILKMLSYVAITAVFCVAMWGFAQWEENYWWRLGFNTLCVLAFVGHILYHDLPLHRIILKKLR